MSRVKDGKHRRQPQKYIQTTRTCHLTIVSKVIKNKHPYFLKFLSIIHIREVIQPTQKITNPYATEF